jgi:hypothetical protein
MVLLMAHPMARVMVPMAYPMAWVWETQSLVE